jgi:hypothetical protein
MAPLPTTVLDAAESVEVLWGAVSVAVLPLLESLLEPVSEELEPSVVVLAAEVARVVELVTVVEAELELELEPVAETELPVLVASVPVAVAPVPVAEAELPVLEALPLSVPVALLPPEAVEPEPINPVSIYSAKGVIMGDILPDGQAARAADTTAAESSLGQA